MGGVASGTVAGPASRVLLRADRGRGPGAVLGGEAEILRAPGHIVPKQCNAASEADYTVFLMKDQAAVEQAVTHDATRLGETQLELGI